MQDLLREIKQTANVTILHVTHSTEEADALADCRIELDNGKFRML